VAGRPDDAAELTEAGRRVEGRLAALPGAPRFRAPANDHRATDFGDLPAARRAAVLTCHSVEQVPAIPAGTMR